VTSSKQFDFHSNGQLFLVSGTLSMLIDNLQERWLLLYVNMWKESTNQFTIHSVMSVIMWLLLMPKRLHFLETSGSKKCFGTTQGEMGIIRNLDWIKLKVYCYCCSCVVHWKWLIEFNHIEWNWCDIWFSYIFMLLGIKWSLKLDIFKIHD